MGKGFPYLAAWAGAWLISLALSGCYSQQPASSTMNISDIPDRVALVAALEGLEIDFGTQAAFSSTDLTLHLMNTGPYPASRLQPNKDATVQSPFSFKGGSYPGEGGTCSDRLEGGASCTIVISYQPKDHGPHSGTLALEYINGILVAPLEFSLTGQASAGIASDAGPEYNFGVKAIGSTTYATLTLSNSGSTTASTIAEDSAHALAPPFFFEGDAYPGTDGSGTSGTCGATLEPGASCTIIVKFAPVTDGTPKQDLRLVYKDGAIDRVFVQRLNGQTPGKIAISGTDPFFLRLRAGLSAEQAFTVSNVGGATATVLEIPLTQVPVGPEFSITGNDCASTLAPDQTCTIKVQFAPVAAGSVTGTLKVRYSNGQDPGVLDTTKTIQGTGQSGWSTGSASPLAPRYFHSAIWSGKEMIVWGGRDGSGAFNDGARYNPTTNTWTPMSMTNAPVSRSRHTAIWADSLTPPRMIVFGGIDGAGHALDSGGMYDPASDSWVKIENNTPPARYGHTAVWDSSHKQMLLFGGAESSVSGTSVLSSFKFYGFDPLSGPEGTWTKLSDASSPTPRYQHSAVWTGSSMIVWGGCSVRNATNAAEDSCQIGSETDTGSIYDPTTNSWSAIQAAGAAQARFQHSAVWSGSTMIVFGGAKDTGGNGTLSTKNTGSIFTPGAVGTPGSWDNTTMNDDVTRDAKRSHLAVWTDTDMILWGGPALTRDGLRYAPGSPGAWTTLAGAAGVTPTVNFGTAGVYTGTTDRRLIVFGGADVSGGGAPTNFSNVLSIYAPE